MPYHFITVLWGSVFRDLYASVALPSQLAPENLRAVAGDPRSVYRIFTTSEDEAVLRETPAFKTLSRFLRVEFVPLEESAGDPWHKMTVAQVRAIREAEDASAAMVFLPPDAVWSDGAFRHMNELACAGKRAVVVAGLRVHKQPFVAEIDSFRRDGALSLPARPLARTAMRHLHPATKSLFWNAEHFNDFPSHLYWSVGGEGIVARCFHLHPLMVNPEIKGGQFAWTIDGDYLPVACPDPRTVEIVADSDRLLCCEMSDLSRMPGRPRKTSKRLFETAFFAFRYANAYHRRFARTAICFRTGVESDDWDKVIEDSGRVIARVDRAVEAGFLFFSSAEALSNTREKFKAFRREIRTRWGLDL